MTTNSQSTVEFDRTPPYPNSKDSGVEWLGRVPEHWEVKRLKWLFRRLKITNCPDAELLSVYRDYGVIPKSSRDDNFNKPSEDLSAYQLVQIGDLVLNKMKTWQGSIAISRYEGIVSPAYFVAKPKAEFDLQFVHYLLRSPVYIGQYLRHSQGIRPNQWDLGFEEFANIEAILPPIAEQRAIAAFLDRETARLDTLIARQGRLIELSQEKRRALIGHAVTRGLNDRAPRKDSGVEWLGEVPEHWEVKRLRFLVTLNPSKQEISDLPKDLEVSFLPMESVGDDGSLNLENTKPISEVESGYTFFRDGDVTIAKITPCFENGKGALMNGLKQGIGFGTTELTVLRPSSEIVPEFLYYLTFSTVMRKLGEGQMYGAGGQKRVPEDFYRNFETGFPPLDEQRAIVAYLDGETAKIDTLIAKARRAIELMKEHRSALVAAAVTGQIDVRGA